MPTWGRWRGFTECFGLPVPIFLSWLLVLCRGLPRGLLLGDRVLQPRRWCGAAWRGAEPRERGGEPGTAVDGIELQGC